MSLMRRLWQRPLSRFTVVALLLLLLSAGTMSMKTVSFAQHARPTAASSCQLNSASGAIQHVIFIQFDNTHFTRDNPNVPSDLEQMPDLLNFIENNGVLISNEHTPLIAHTADDVITSVTGVYGDQHGVPIANTYGYFNPDGTSSMANSFTYWTDPLNDTKSASPSDTTYNLLTAGGQNAPAPWVPFTRAGCNFGSVLSGNTALENTGTDITTVFGANSPEEQEAKSNQAKAQADFVGIAIHCAAGNALCSSANNGKPDLLPDEPGGYNGYMALFGNKYVAPQISPNGPMTDLDGNVIQDSKGNQGFPGFDSMSASVSLSYVAAMQEHGVPITYAYISDAHDNHTAGTAYGPGEAGYVAQLKAYDDAFGKFFTRLANDGINKSNTLFVFTADEGDHFVGGAPSPTNCDGVTTPCTYSQIGEIDVNLTGLLATQQNVTTAFNVHADSAPNFYLTGNPSPSSSTVRSFEHAVAALTATNPITNATDTLTNYMADPVEMKLLHMITGDPARTPTFTVFGNPDYYQATGAANCSSPCVAEGPTYAWNHGDVSPDINTTWLGMVGPGVNAQGVDSTTWSDHTDIRPTILELVGLKDDYTHEGRVLFEDLSPSALPASVTNSQQILTQLAQVFKEINAPVGQLGLQSLQISTKAIESNDPGDSTYLNLESQLTSITTQRDSLASQMLSVLEGAEFNNQPVDATQAQQLINQGNTLLQQVSTLAGSNWR
ncbi:MAG TPA: hypothetical protein VKV40_25170 [Ktedonobacteraceae bacterium]|nr:hypothetical protein [Ktedonobacteraceae bacterium]